MKDGNTYRPTTYLLIEDEYYSRQEMKSVIARLRPHYVCAGEVEGVESGIEFLRNHTVDLIIADICVCDGYSPDVFRRTGCRTPVIITTGYAQYRHLTREMNVVDYLLKPVAPQVLVQSLEKFENNYNPITITKN